MTTCQEYYMEVKDNGNNKVQWNCKDWNRPYNW